ncbi:MAG TPA: adenylate/guanylate cyclase domain-containing protein [Gaiellaceae bacterium]|nr:adenylate/guanylate cyclase domain-containing protein [Gaiellaceae bacterium]
MAVCGNCGADNLAGKRFCGDCGTALAVGCSACGAENPPGKRFCGDCGAVLGETAAQAAPAGPARAPVAERKLVSVLFADLVGFTSASEARDAEDTRELLSRYFEACRRLISLYGGTVEKFIGDAVMAVWGAPVANEDDAERAVRAALELVAAVPQLDPSLAARAGVLTGEAAVTLGAEGQGMVAGDLVNTASRIQSAAEPGTVLVGEATRRATEAAVAYEPAGSRELKGKSEPVPLYLARRVTAARKGAQKSVGLEPPFVGRDRELRLVKELFHACAEEGKAQLVSVVGIAGIGKTRLAWEFEKYVDGLAEDFWWHRGRCLAYGEGIAYWALAEMVRMRAGILEEEAPDSVLAKLRGSIEEHVADPEERSWLEPRLAHLLGVAERTAPDREDLFAAWRLFFERLAERQPVVLVFEDLQWADAGLLDFVEYLLEWSHAHPLYVLALARPELSERRAGFGAGGRNLTTLSLEPLSGPAMEQLLDRFVPGLPTELRARMLARSEGVPLYAVETVRMLLDRELLEREGDVYRPTGPIEALDVPETLHALVAARLDGLDTDERRLLQDAAVLGKSFTRGGLAALSGRAEAELDPLLAGLVRKEVLSVQSDPRSPERGQYGFLQDLLKRVAYETLAKGERKARHLAAAAYLAQAFGAGEQEIVEVIAAHYLDAYLAAPEAPDAPEIRTKAQAMLTQAGERASSLAANEEAQHCFEQAADLAEEPAEEAGLRERAGSTARLAGRSEQAERHLARALELYASRGLTHPAARVSARLGEVEWRTGRLEQALERMERAFEVLSGDEPDADLATLAAELGRLHYFKGEVELAATRLDTAIDVAEALGLTEVLSQALNTQGLLAASTGRSEQSLALIKHALELALEHDLAGAALRAYNNLGNSLETADRCEEAIDLQRRGIALARKAGDRVQEWGLLGELAWCLQRTGRWSEALDVLAEVPDEQLADGVSGLATLGEIAVARGDLGEGERLLSLLSVLKDSADFQARAGYLSASSQVRRLAGRFEEALVAAEAAIAAGNALAITTSDTKVGFAEALESALALGRLEQVEQLLSRIDAIPPGRRPPFLVAQAARFRARLAAARGEEGSVEQGFKTASAVFREHGLIFYVAVTGLEHCEWLIGGGRAGEAEPLLDEAREIFERLEARPWLERAAAVPAAVPA